MSTASIETAPVPSRAATWLRALRLYSVTASVIPVLFGIVLARAWADRLGLLLAVPALLGGVLIHLGTNLINDVGDYETGVDHLGALGGSGVLVDRSLTPRDVRRAAWLCFALAALIGIGLCLARGFPMLALGTLGILGGWGYTAGPRYKYLGLGDPFVFLLMGPLMVTGGWLAMTRELDPLFLFLVSIPIGLMVTAILHANNIRDLEADRDAGLRTLAIALGRARSLVYFRVLVYGAYLAVALLVAFSLLRISALLVFATLPLAHKCTGALANAGTIAERRAAPLVERTAQLHLAFGLALIVGTLLGFGVVR